MEKRRIGQGKAIQERSIEADMMEVSALLAREAREFPDRDRREALYLRLAVICWILFEDLDAALRYLDEIESLSADGYLFKRSLLLAAGDRVGLRRLLDLSVSEGVCASISSCTLAAAETFAFVEQDWQKTAARSKHMFGGPFDESLNELVTLALEMAKDRKALMRHLSEHGGMAGHFRLATIVGDVEEHREESMRILREMLDTLQGADEHDSSTEAMTRLVLERLWELNFVRPPLRIPAAVGVDCLLGKKLELLGDVPEEMSEANVVRYLLAQWHREQGALDRTAEMLESLAQSENRWGRCLALESRRAVAVERAQWKELSGFYSELADELTGSSWSGVYRFRAAELAECSYSTDEEVETLARQALADLKDGAQALAMLERILARRGDVAGLADLFEAAAERTGKHHYARWAAHVVEFQVSDPERAKALRFFGTTDPSFEDLLDRVRVEWRLHHADQVRTLCETLAGCAIQQGDGDSGKWWSSIWSLAAGLSALRVEDGMEAERLLKQAVDADSSEPVASMALAVFYRRWGQWDAAIERLEMVGDLLRSTAAKVHALRTLARVAGMHTDRTDLAEKSLEKALELTPDDPAVLHEMALLADKREDFERGLQLRHKAATLLEGSFRAAVLWAEIGRSYAEHGDDEAAEKAFVRSLDVDESQMDVLTDLSDIYRRQRRWPELLESVQLLLERDEEHAADLHVEAARLVLRQHMDTSEALGHYRTALEINPEHDKALNGLERLCRREGRWAELIDALRKVPANADRVTMLLNAFERLSQWDELIEVAEKRIEETGDVSEVAELARRIASVYESQLGQPDDALTWYKKAFVANPGDREVAAVYEKYLSREERWEDLAEALKREVQVLSDDKKRALKVRRRLADVLADRLGQVGEAVSVLEQVDKDGEANEDIWLRLADLYGRLGRVKDELDVLERIAGSSRDRDMQVSLLVRAGKVREEKGDDEGALQTYIRAFQLDPAHRDAFTAVERLCYKLKVWKETLDLYNRAIELVEQQGSRAYRLADLYARRGQLQLQYMSQPGEAAASYLKVLELDPNEDRTVKFLESIFSEEGDWEGLMAGYDYRISLLDDPKKRAETYRRAARVAAGKLNDQKRASEYYAGLLKDAPGDDEALDALERHYERNRLWEELANILLMKLERPAEKEIRVARYLRLGLIYEEGLQDAQRAVDAYKQGLELDPNNVKALESLARIYEATERWAEFVDVARKQIRQTGDRNSKALLYFKCGSVMEAKFSKENDAIRYYKAAIKTSPSCLPAVHGLRDLYLRKQEWQRVLETLELETKLWQEPREKAGVFAQIGKVYLDGLGDSQKARRYFESARNLDPESVPAVRALFDMAFDSQNWSRAVELASLLGQKAMREGEPAERSEFYRKRGVVAEKTRHFQAAAENYVAALDARPENLAALDALTALCRSHPSAYEYQDVFKELDHRYKRMAWPEAQARILVARGALQEQSYQIDEAESSYRQAVTLAPGDLSVLGSMVDLLYRLRRWSDAVKLLEEFVRRSGVSQDDRVQALVRAGGIMSEGAMDTRAAEKLFLRALRLQSRSRDALYGLAQELVLQRRLQEAQRRCAELIEVAADPAHTAPPEDLGLYYYYQGRIFEAMGDARKAGLSYRRAADLNPGYPPPVIALGERYLREGDIRQAESLLSSSSVSAEEVGRFEEALELRRALARLQAESGNLDAAIGELRAIVADDRGKVDDRIGLARLYLRTKDGSAAAIEQLLSALEQEPANVLAIQLLASVWATQEQWDAVRRAWDVMLLLGRSGDVPEQATATVRPSMEAMPHLRVSDEVTQIASRFSGPFENLFRAIRGGVDLIYPVTYIGKNHVPYTDAEVPGFVEETRWLLNAFGWKDRADVFVAEDVPGRLSLMTKGERVQVVLDRVFVSGDIGIVRFALAKALAYERFGLTVLGRLGPKERNEVGQLLLGIAVPAEKRLPQVVEFLDALPRKEHKAADRIALAAGEDMLLASPRQWMRDVDRSTERLALAFLDDIVLALKAMALMQAEEMVIESGQNLALVYGVDGAWELLPYYIGPDQARAIVALSSEPDQKPVQN